MTLFGSQAFPAGGDEAEYLSGLTMGGYLTKAAAISKKITALGAGADMGCIIGGN